MVRWGSCKLRGRKKVQREGQLHCLFPLHLAVAVCCFFAITVVDLQALGLEKESHETLYMARSGKSLSQHLSVQHLSRSEATRKFTTGGRSACSKRTVEFEWETLPAAMASSCAAPRPLLAYLLWTVRSWGQSVLCILRVRCCRCSYRCDVAR